uniref:Germinal-center associated nuclear protein n=1 Tax=Lepisosteus oculatus TaxID=7918 RepID=W5MR25_LEPOC|nr:PREDICTED: germinal-center associated nuclear protein [Lepisosteus oculatus]
MFGRQQGGAFQAPSSTNSSGGIFQSFGQGGAGGAPPTVGYGQTSAFNQPTLFGQQSAFGQTPSFGQTSAVGQGSLFDQSSRLGQSSIFSLSGVQGQSQAFGQPSQSNAGFGILPSYSQSTGAGQTSAFGQPPPYGQTTGLGQQSGPSAQATVFGQSSGFAQSSGFSQAMNISQASTVPTPSSALGQTPAISSFGQTSAFGMPSGTLSSSSGSQSVTFTSPSSSSSSGGLFASTSSSVFKTADTGSRGFANPQFTFKPSDTAVFKPIFSGSPEPSNPQAGPAQGSFSTVQPVASVGTSSGTSSGFSLLSASSGGALEFSFSQPTAASSISSKNVSLPQTEGHPNTTSSSLEFTFSQPAAPSNSITTGGVGLSQASDSSISASAFSFSEKVLEAPVSATPLFGAAGFVQASAFGDQRKPVKPEAVARRDEKDPAKEMPGDAAFASIGKGTKRKEEQAEQKGQGKALRVDGSGSGSESPSRYACKKPLRSRGPGGGLFRSALSGVLKSTVQPVKKEIPREEEPQPGKAEIERPDTQPQDTHPSSRAPGTPPRGTPRDAEVNEKAKPDAGSKTPARRTQRRESSDGLAGLSPTDAISIQCKNIPPHLNKKEILEKHFGRFGKVLKVYCRPNKSLATVHFHDHASAAKAKKKGKSLNREEIAIFWNRKKPSPGEKAEISMIGDEAPRETESRHSAFQASPLRKPLSRSPIVSGGSLTKGSPVKKSLIAKTLQFDTESQHDSGSEGQSSDHLSSTLPSSLSHLIGQVAETSEEKYRLLEQRDKILRQGRTKRTELDLSKVFVGTCPDMCPEKERYMRETRNQLSSFEIIPGTEWVDPTAAIKEYSRSSADQEEPLPHELRPLPVLSMTMDYLVTQIMDKGEGNYRDWYDFVWNRTRGIRKDITQQHLCDPLTVALIEKCTRFHIHCAHHLCEEPMMTFDAKINNENMTKCLQSLKEMYQDLASRNVYCPGEKEFRQYNVLLKLNDGDILREVQQFRPEIRNSLEVKFAVQVFAALNSNNFVRFFRLVRVASYLSSCILHRYFNQMRRDALKALNIAYTVGSQRPTTFPIEDLVRMLMFRDAAEAGAFIMHYGLNVSEGMVELSRSAFQEPVDPAPIKRSVDIMAKRPLLIGEVINGGPLPSPARHTPLCSFDSRSRYRGDGLMMEPAPTLHKGGPLGAAVPAEPMKQDLKPLMELRPLMDLDVKSLMKPKLQGESRFFEEPKAVMEMKPKEAERVGSASVLGAEPLFQQIVQPEPTRPPSPPPKPQPVYTDQDIMEEVQSLVEDVLKAECRELAKAGADYMSAALSVSDGQVGAVVNEVVEQMLKEVCIGEITSEKERIAEEKRRIEEARRKQEHEMLIAQISKALCEEIAKEVLKECIEATAACEIKQALEEKAACVARCSEDACNTLIEETLESEISKLANDILTAEVQRFRKFVKRWRDVVAVRRQLKRQMRAFPAAPCCVDPRFKLKALAPSAPSPPSLDLLARSVVNLGNAGNVAVSCTRLLQMRNAALHQMKVHYFYRQLLSESAWTPLDLPSLVAESFPSPANRIYWKAALLLPSNEECEMSVTNSILTDWLKAKFGGRENSENMEQNQNDKIQTLSICNGLRNHGDKSQNVHICIKVTHGPLSLEGMSQMERQKDVLGTSALLLLLPSLPGYGATEEKEELDVYLLSALLQLKQIQQVYSWQSALPLVVVVPKHAEQPTCEEKLEEGLMLQALVEENLISEYIFVHVPHSTNDLQGSEQIHQAVKWLVSRSPAAPDLSSQTLVQFVEDGLCREFSTRFYHDKTERQASGLPCQEPAPIIELYNSVLRFLAGLVSSEQFSRLSWPVAEFSVPRPQNLLPHLEWNSPEHLAWLNRAILTLQIPDWDLPAQHASWPGLCARIFQFVAQIPFSRHSHPLLVSKVGHLLKRVHSEWMRGAMSAQEEEEAGPAFQQVPWDEIVALCIDHRLKDWKPPESPVTEDAITDDGEILVYFVKEDLKKYEPPSSWLWAVRKTHKDKQQESFGFKLSPARVSTPRLLHSRQRLFDSPVEKPGHATVADITHTPSSRELLPHRLLSSLEAERAQSQRFEEQLQQWLEVDPLDSFSMPLFMPSTLISVPEIMAASQRAFPASAAVSLSMEAGVPGEKWDRSGQRGCPVSMEQRLQDLDRQIRASKEEELACELQLSSLLDIVED